jgi:hypothetical protein
MSLYTIKRDRLLNIKLKNIFKYNIIVHMPKTIKKTITKLILTLDARNIYKDEKKSRIIELIFTIKENKLNLKIGARYVEVGRLEQIRLSEYCNEIDINCDFVLSRHNDVYKITLDKDVLTDLYEHKHCLSVEDLSLIFGYLHYTEDKAFYNICLLDFSEIPKEIQSEYIDGKNYEYIALENKIIYPDILYKMELS